MQAEVTFLHEEIIDTEHKIARYKNALDSCRECQEAESLQSMVHTAQDQLDLLNDLLAHQTSENPLSVGSLITMRIEALQQEAERLESGWHRGHTVSPNYWELENKREFLTDLLRRYHAWESGRPYYPPVLANGEATAKQAVPPVYSHPWYIPVPPNSGVTNGQNESEDQSTILTAVQQTVYTLLHQQGFPDHHLKVTAQPDGSVFITGYSHSEDQREQILKAVGTVPGIREVLAGIQIVDPAHCPVCTLPQNQTGRAE